MDSRDCACCRHDGHSTYIRSPIARSMLSVCYGRSRSSVRIAALPIVREGGRRLVNLADIWWAACLPIVPARLRFDFKGDDGFDTARKRGEPLTGDVLTHGFVDVDTRDISWAVPVPCFYRVKGLTTMNARMHAPARPRVDAVGPTSAEEAASWEHTSRPLPPR